MTRRFLLSALVLLSLVGTACGRYLTTGVATVNGKSISQGDLDKQFDSVRQSQQFAGQFDPNNAEQRLEVERQIIVGLIQQELIRQEGVRLRLKVTDAQVDQALQQVKAQFQSEQAFLDALKQNGLTLTSIRTQVRDQVLLDEVRNRALGNLQATEQEIRRAYGDGKRFEEIRVRHILYTAEGSSTATAKRQAEATLAKLKAGADFAAIAKKESDDSGSKAKGGDLGYVTRDVQFDAQFLAAAFALKEGQLSGVVQTQFGFHIIRVDDRRTKTLAQVRAELAQQITQEKSQQGFQDFIKKVIARAEIVVNPRWGDFDPETLQITARQFFVPPTPEPETQPFPLR